MDGPFAVQRAGTARGIKSRSRAPATALFDLVLYSANETTYSPLSSIILEASSQRTRRFSGGAMFVGGRDGCASTLALVAGA